MLIVGEWINARRKSIADAIVAQDGAQSRKKALDRLNAGAHLIDVNVGVFVGEEVKHLRWFVQTFADIGAEVAGERPVLKGVRYYTDAVAFVPVLKAPMIICGPGDAKLAHQPNEDVEISKLVQAARIYTLAAAKLLE